MKTTNKSTVNLVDWMGNDLTVANAARVSFDKESEWTEAGNLKEQDAKLINYLAKHNHWSPFAHTSIQLRVNAPLIVMIDFTNLVNNYLVKRNLHNKNGDIV